MSQSKNKTPQAQAPTLGTNPRYPPRNSTGNSLWSLGSDSLGEWIQRGAPPPESPGQSPKLPGGMGQQSSLPEMAPEPANSQVASQQSQDTS